MKQIYNSDKLCITSDTYGREYVFEVYDSYGHYIDEVKFSKEEMVEFVDDIVKFSKTL